MLRTSVLRATSSRFATQSPIYRRAMAAGSAPTQEWLVMLPDREGMLDKRIEVRPKHLERVVPDVKSGKVLMGGAMLAKPLEEGQPPSMIGSMFITTAHSKEDIISWMKSDIYGTSGVWDIEKAQIIPIRIAVRKSMPDLGTES